MIAKKVYFSPIYSRLWCVKSKTYVLLAAVKVCLNYQQQIIDGDLIVLNKS